MSWHLSHRLTTVHRAVSMALLYSVSYAALSSSAQAAIIGKTVITSAQHEPLAARIIVTDIKSADFSASLASSDVYQRMGLTPTASMIVRFEPTSATTGQLLITTSQPVSKPFADIVLAINDGAQRNVIPKTLLMPLHDSAKTKSSNNVITAAKKPNLPAVSVNNPTPLTVRQGTPPPLLSAPKLLVPTTSPDIQTQTLSLPTALAPTLPTSQAGYLVTTPSDSANNDFNNSDNDSSHSSSNTDLNTNSVMSNSASTATLNTGSGNSTLSTGTTDKQSEILNIQVIRKIQLSNSIDNRANSPVDNSIIAPAPPITASIPKNNIKPMFELIPDDSKVANNNSMVTQTVPSANNSATANYTVQRNDNLWTISQQIAQKNNLDVQTVMAQIQSQNPDAFINKDANQLKADTQLDLTEYELVPSQQSLQAAINAQRQYIQQAKKQVSKQKSKLVTKKPAEPKPAPNTQAKRAQTATQVSKRPEKSATTTTQALPKARFSVLAPGRDGRADGTQTKAAAATGSGLSTDILATLKSTRQSTAAQAKRLSKTNDTLGSYTRKLQLQNQKLAELQARLKKLRNQ